MPTRLIDDMNHTHPAARQTDAVAAAVLVLPEFCYRCGRLTKSIVGLLLPSDLTPDPDGFVEFDVVAPLIAAAVPNSELGRFGIGPLKMRRSRLQPDGYLSNGCLHCDSIQGSFPLHEGLTEFLAEGGSYSELVGTHCTISRTALTARLVDCDLA